MSNRKLPALPGQDAEWSDSLRDPLHFTTLSNIDEVSVLFDKYFPGKEGQRNIYKHDATTTLEQLELDGAWHALADRTKDLLIAGNATDIADSLSLWTLRLKALQNLNAASNLQQEVELLSRLLPPSLTLPLPPIHQQTYPVFNADLPFELILLLTIHMANQSTSLNRLLEVLQGTKREYWHANEIQHKMLWKARSLQVGQAIVNNLLLKKNYITAISFCQTLAVSFPEDAQAANMLFRIQLLSGQICAATITLATIPKEQQSEESTFILALARGDLANTKIEASALSDPKLRSNCMAIADLISGNALSAYEGLATNPRTHPSTFYNSTPCVSNLATILELVQTPSVPTRLSKLALLSEGAEHARESFPATSFKL